MNTIITNFLFRNGYCPLPSVGSLKIITEPAKCILGTNSLIGPKSKIIMLSEEENKQSLLNDIAGSQAISLPEAEEKLESFCNSLKNLQDQQEVILEDAGKFYVDENGYLAFEEKKIFTNYFPDVVAERVVHPNQVHEILVGDKETNSTQMTSFYEEAKIEKRSKLWLYISLALIIVAGIFIYFSTTPHTNKKSGNRQGVVPTAADVTYKILK